MRYIKIFLPFIYSFIFNSLIDFLGNNAYMIHESNKTTEHSSAIVRDWYTVDFLNNRYWHTQQVLQCISSHICWQRDSEGKSAGSTTSLIA